MATRTAAVNNLSTRAQTAQRATPPARRLPPVPAPVLRRLYIGLLRARMAAVRPVQPDTMPDGIVVAATLQLRPQDVLIPPADRNVFRLCELIGSSGSSSHSLQVLRLPRGAHWQAAMAMYLSLGWRQRRRSSAILALVADDFLSSAYRQATLELLRHVHEQKLPIVYVTQTPASRGTRLGADLRAGGVPRIPVDGGDAVAVYRVCQEALRRAREGTGPTLVDCHLGGAQDDVVFLENFLGRYGLWSARWKEKLLRDIRADSKVERPGRKK